MKEAASPPPVEEEEAEPVTRDMKESQRALELRKYVSLATQTSFTTSITEVFAKRTSH